MSPPPLTEITHSAFWASDEAHYHGHRVFTDLAGKESWTGMMGLSIFGRRLSPDICGVLDDAAGALTLADPRIWPLKLTRVVGSYGGLLPALFAGQLAEDGARIGPWACVEASKALIALHAEIDGKQDDVEHVAAVVAEYRRKHRFVAGFGTPYRGLDERVPPFRRCLERRGRTALPYYRTLDAVARAMKRTTRAELNIGGVMAAVLLDVGLEPLEIGATVVALISHMFLSQAFESARAPNLSVRELPPAYVTYSGREPRASPRAHPV